MSTFPQVSSRLSFSLTIGAVCIFGVFSVVQGLSFTAYWRRHFFQQEQIESWFLAEQISRKLDTFLFPNLDFGSLRTAVDEILEVNPSVEIYLVENSGEVAAVFSREPQTKIPSQIDLRPIESFLHPGARNEVPMFASDPQLPSRKVIFSAARARISKGSGFVFVVLKNRRAARIQVRAFDEGAFFGVALSSLIALLIASVVAYFLTRHLVSRLRNLMTAVRDLDGGNLSARVESHGKDEIAELARALNQMATSLQGSYAELERKDSLRRELISNIWHDVRGPIAVLQGLGDILAKQRGDSSGAEVVQGMVANARQLNHFLDELRALSELETGESSIRLDAVDLLEVCEEVYSAILPVAKESPVELLLIVPEGDIPFAAGDAGLLFRLLRNLVENAIRYTPPGGTIRIRLEHERETILLSVEDTGIGISDVELPRVFERYFQSRNGNEDRYGSGGLGLAIVRKIAEAHGTNVSVSSSPGSGTTFLLPLPIFRSNTLNIPEESATPAGESFGPHPQTSSGSNS